MPGSDLALPFLTSAPGIGGVLKNSAEDFRVDELPLYAACGEGEHLYLCVEKRELTTPDLVRHIARRLGIPAGEIGFAGRKDRQAVTRQYVSVPAARCPDPAVLETDRIHVLDAKRHRNKLRTGHLKGNAFRIVLRETRPDALSLALQVAGELAARGVPNYFGEQRFGVTSETDLDGFRLLRGELTRRLSADALRFTLSAVQSRLFNEWARGRIEEGLSHQVLEGDVMQVLASGGCFVVADAAAEQRRFEQRETVVTGPMFGPQMVRPSGLPAQRESAVLQKFDLVPESFERFRKLTSGTRRQLLVWPEDLHVTACDGGLEFIFTLPPGAYATCVLREFSKQEPLSGGSIACKHTT